MLMRLILISGNYHEIITPYLEGKYTLVNDRSLELGNLNDFISKIDCNIDCVLITDHAFSGSIEKEKEQLLIFMQWLEGKSCPIVIITNDHMLMHQYKDIFDHYGLVSYVVYDWLRPTERVIKEAINKLKANRNSNNNLKEDKVKTKKKISFFSFLKNTQKEKNIKPRDDLTREFENIGLTVSRVVAITGHRGSGVTSTSVNLAYQASKHGLKSIIVDLDIEYRSINMYFNKYHETTLKDEIINSSLIRTLAKPQDYKTTTFCINDDLWVISLGYNFADIRLIEQFYNSTRIIGLLSVLRNNFNLVILDMPLDVFRTLSEVILHIDVFGLCVVNNLYSILNTIRKMECVLGNEDMAFLKSKSSLIISKYNLKSKFNNDFFTPEKVNKILTSGLNNNFVGDMRIAGNIPYCDEFDKQIETDIPISDTNTDLKENYTKILIRLMGG